MARSSISQKLTAFFVSGAPFDPASSLHADVRRFIDALIGAAAAAPLLAAADPTLLVNLLSGFTPILGKASDAKELVLVANYWPGVLRLARTKPRRRPFSAEPGPDQLDALVAGFREDFVQELAAPLGDVPTLDELLRARLLAILKRSGDIRKLKRIWRSEIIARRRGAAAPVEKIVAGEAI